MPLTENHRKESKSIEDLIAQLESPIEKEAREAQKSKNNGSQTSNHSNNSNGRTILKGKRQHSSNSLSMATSAPQSSGGSSSFMRQTSFGQNSEPLLSKNILTSKKYTKHSNTRAALKTAPKKNGGGGKFTWGAPGSEYVDYLDKNDPNYDSSEENRDAYMASFQRSRSKNSGDYEEDEEENEDHDENLKDLLSEDLETEIKPVILEYFQNGDTIEVIDHLKCYRINRLKPQLVSFLVQFALEHNNTSKELTSRLLRDLNLELFNERDFVLGFDLLLKNINDLTLDCPEACDKIGIFIARAIADKIIASNYLHRFFDSSSKEKEDLPDIINDVRVSKAVDGARVLVNMNDHNMYHLSHIWGAKGGFLAVKELTDKINELIQEYHDSGDLNEAVRCLKELNVPHFYHEFVFEVSLVEKKQIFKVKDRKLRLSSPI